MYRWRNGTSTAGVTAVDDIHLFPGFSPLELEHLDYARIEPVERAG